MLLWFRDQSYAAITNRLAKTRARAFWTVVWAALAFGGFIATAMVFGFTLADAESFIANISSWNIWSVLMVVGTLAVMLVARRYVGEWNTRLSLYEVIETLDTKKDTDMSVYFSPQSLQLIDQSYLKTKNRPWHPWYLFTALVDEPKVEELIIRLGFVPEDWKKKQKKMQVKDTLTSEASTALFKHVVSKSLEIAYKNNDALVRQTDLLEALMIVPSMVRDVLVDYGVRAESLSGVNTWIHRQHYDPKRKRFTPEAELSREKTWRNQLWTSTVTPILDACGVDLTAHMSRMPAFVGRHEEFTQLYEIVGNGQFGIVLTGPKGSGKHAFIWGLAHKIIHQKVPEFLADRRVVTLSIARLLALSGPSNPLKTVAAQLIREIARSGNIVIVLEDLADFESARTDDAALLVESLLSDAMKSGHVLLLATVDNEVREKISGSLIASLTELAISPMQSPATIRVVESHVPTLERQFNVGITYPAIERAVALADSVIHDHTQPGKSLNLLHAVTESVALEGNEQWVRASDVEKIVAEKTGLPVTSVGEQEEQLLLNLEQTIHEKYINQVSAVKAVAAALRRARTELTSASRPIANFLFLGPTGVGKTELARRLAAVYFGGSEKMVRLDMSEYQEPQSLRNLIGAPPGTGSKEPGHLISAVAKNPFTVILLDEFEKAHPDILNIFLQVMEDGRLTAPNGETYDFTNSLIIATSNAGSQDIQDGIKRGDTIEKITEDVKNTALSAYFKPELLNRFDALIVFEPLKFHDIVKVTQLLLDQLTEQLHEREINFEVTSEAIEELATEGYDPTMGARPLRRVIQDKIEDQIAKLLLKKTVRARDTLVLKKGFELEVRQAEHY